MKKRLALVLAGVMMVSSLAGCGSSKPAETTVAAAGETTAAAADAVPPFPFSAFFSDAPYPDASTAAMISDADAVPSTPMELVSRLTEHDVTPGTLDTAFSTRLLHAAQLIPVTRSPSCSIF
jgi:hypothetical protein